METHSQTNVNRVCQRRDSSGQNLNLLLVACERHDCISRRSQSRGSNQLTQLSRVCAPCIHICARPCNACHATRCNSQYLLPLEEPDNLPRAALNRFVTPLCRVEILDHISQLRKPVKTPRKDLVRCGQYEGMVLPASDGEKGSFEVCERRECILRILVAAKSV